MGEYQEGLKVIRKVNIVDSRGVRATTSYLPPGKISLSKDGSKVKLEDLTLTDGVKIDSLEMEISSLPQLINILNEGKLNFKLDQIIKNSKINVKFFRISLSENYLDKTLRKMISSGSSPFSLRGSKLEEGIISLDGEFKASLMPSLPFKIKLIPGVNGSGDLTFKVSKLSVAFLPLPSFLNALALNIADALGLAPDEVTIKGDEVRLSLNGVRFSEVSVRDGKLTLEGQVTENVDLQEDSIQRRNR